MVAAAHSTSHADSARNRRGVSENGRHPGAGATQTIGGTT